MNKKQLACEAIVLQWAEVAEESRLRQFHALKQNGAILSDNTGRTADILGKRFGVSSGYIKKYRKLFLEDRDAFDYVHQTGKDIPRLRTNGVYLISAGLPNPTKIGRTDCLEMRLSSIQTGCWLPLEVVKWMPMKDAASFETELHLAFNKKRLNGEWFILTENDFILIDIFYNDKQLGQNWPS